MSRKTPYPAGSPMDVLIRVEQIRADIEQQIRDIQSCNDNNPNFADVPMDTGRYVVQLDRVKRVIREIKVHIDMGVAKLPRDILAPICEEW